MREGGRGMNAKQYAEELYNKYYAIIFEYGEEMSQEIVISQLAKKCAIESLEHLISEWNVHIQTLEKLKQTLKELEQL